MLSVNTNAGSLSALRHLEANHKWLEKLQTRVATGLDVSSVKDNPAVYSFAQNLRSHLKGLDATLGSIDRATVTVDIATLATETVSNLLIEMKGKAVSLREALKNNDDVSAALYKNDLDGLKETINSIVSSAGFNGTNLIDQGNDILTALADDSGTDTIDFDHKNLRFGGGIITLGEDDDYTVEAIEASIDNVNSALSHFGTASRRLEIQREFTVKVQGVIEKGIGRLVDANLAKTAADIQAAQIKEQLGIIALNIANQEPKVLLSLFQN